MSIQEKKVLKALHLLLLKFSDNTGEFELFLFAEILINNRDKILESESFVLTLFKDRLTGDQSQRRVNIKKISEHY